MKLRTAFIFLCVFLVGCAEPSGTVPEYEHSIIVLTAFAEGDATPYGEIMKTSDATSVCIVLMYHDGEMFAHSEYISFATEQAAEERAIKLKKNDPGEVVCAGRTVTVYVSDSPYASTSIDQARLVLEALGFFVRTD